MGFRVRSGRSGESIAGLLELLSRDARPQGGACSGAGRTEHTARSTVRRRTPGPRASCGDRTDAGPRPPCHGDAGSDSMRCCGGRSLAARRRHPQPADATARMSRLAKTNLPPHRCPCPRPARSAARARAAWRTRWSRSATSAVGRAALRVGGGLAQPAAAPRTSADRDGALEHGGRVLARRVGAKGDEVVVPGEDLRPVGLLGARRVAVRGGNRGLDLVAARYDEQACRSSLLLLDRVRPSRVPQLTWPLRRCGQ